jgi:hypothetical protein
MTWQQQDLGVSKTIESGLLHYNRHFYLHPRMREFFFYHYGGRFYRYIAFPFGWGKSVLWFTKLMRPMVKYIWSEWGYRILPRIDERFCAPTDGRRPAIGRDCRRARQRLLRGRTPWGWFSTYSGYSSEAIDMRGVDFGTLSNLYFQQNTSPYISHDTGTIMTPNDTGGIENRSHPSSVL